MQNIPTISVILPVFNGGNFLKAAIESILNQTFTDFELIILNDGSTDQSIKIIKLFAEKDSRIVVVDRENRGLVATLNEGVQLARADLIARMDADDVSMPERFIIQMAYLGENHKCVCVGSDIEIIDQKGRKLLVRHQFQTDAEIQSHALEGSTSICHPSAMFRKDAFIQCGGYRPEMYPAEDLDLWLRLGEIGSLANVNQVLLSYRIQPESISSKAARDGRQVEVAKLVSKDACKRRGLMEPSFEACRPFLSDGTSDAELSQNLTFGWWAYSSREFFTAASYGLKACLSTPTYRQAFVLLIKALLKMLRS